MQRLAWQAQQRLAYEDITAATPLTSHHAHCTPISAPLLPLLLTHACALDPQSAHGLQPCTVQVR